MAADDTPLSFEPPRSTFGAWVGIVLLFAVFGLFVWAVMGMMPRTDDYEQKRAAVRIQKLKTMRDEVTKDITGYAWVDQAKGTVRMPIERAIELTIAQLSQRKPMPAGPIATPEPAPASPAPVGSAVPAATAAPTSVPAGATPPPVSAEGPNSTIRGQPAGAANPVPVPPGTQPGASATPAASPPTGPAAPNPGQKPVATPVQSPPGTPLPIRGKQPQP